MRCEDKAIWMGRWWGAWRRRKCLSLLACQPSDSFFSFPFLHGTLAACWLGPGGIVCPRWRNIDFAVPTRASMVKGSFLGIFAKSKFVGLQSSDLGQVRRSHSSGLASLQGSMLPREAIFFAQHRPTMSLVPLTTHSSFEAPCPQLPLTSPLRMTVPTHAMWMEVPSTSRPVAPLGACAPLWRTPS